MNPQARKPVGILHRIKKFIKGDTERTAFSADVMNELVDALNIFLAGRGGTGIKMYIAQGGLVVELDDFMQDQLNLRGDGEGGSGNGEQGPGTLKWRGPWSADVDDYKKNDLVIDYSQTALDTPGRGGTFIATRDVPKGTVPYWDPNVTDGQDFSGPGGSLALYKIWKPFASWGRNKLIIRGLSPNDGNSIALDGDTSTVTCTLLSATTVTAGGPVTGTSLNGSVSCESPNMYSPTAFRLNADANDQPVDGSKGIALIKKDDIPSSIIMKPRVLTTWDGVNFHSYYVLASQEIF